MTAEKTNSKMDSKQQPLRPAIIVSKNTLSEFSMLLERLLVGLADESIPIAFVCPPACDVGSIVSPAVQIIRHPAFDIPFFGRANLKILTENLKKFSPTCLHCLSESLSSQAGSVSEFLGIPFLQSVNCLQHRLNLSHLPGRLTAFVVPNEIIAAALARLYPALADKVQLVNAGTFLSRSAVCFSRPDHIPSLVTACPFNEKVDVRPLLGAVKHLTVDGQEFMLVIIGGGPVEMQMRKMVSELGLSDVAVFVPRIEPWRAVLAAGDIFIKPWKSNCFDPILLEAMSLGLAVAACPAGADGLVIENQTAAVFVPGTTDGVAGNEQSIYNCLKALLDNRQGTQRIARQGRQYIKEHHSVSSMINQLIRLYRNA